MEEPLRRLSGRNRVTYFSAIAAEIYQLSLLGRYDFNSIPITLGSGATSFFFFL